MELAKLIIKDALDQQKEQKSKITDRINDLKVPTNKFLDKALGNLNKFIQELETSLEFLSIPEELSTGLWKVPHREMPKVGENVRVLTTDFEIVTAHCSNSNSWYDEKKPIEYGVLLWKPITK